ncbi:MAG: SMP-30/gluconolactonase/LRE family protein [Bryobacteraceae bacterium]|jgi:gluconolactonase
MRFAYAAVGALLLAAPFASSAAAPEKAAPSSKPVASIDLTTAEGLAAAKAEWRYQDAEIIQVDFRGQKTYDYKPHAGVPDFDDSKWDILTPETLKRGHGGNMWFNWYRIKLTVPERVGNVDPTGTTAVFEVSIDDYAEIWVDGELPRYVGQSGGSVVAGFNVPNRVVVGRNLKPGQQFQVAVFGMNGPISAAPGNTLFLRYAKLDFHKEPPGPVAVWPAEMGADVERVAKPFDDIVGGEPKFMKVADGFDFTEGPVWNREGNYLLFSDSRANKIYKYDLTSASLSVFRENSGYSGADIAEYAQPGSKGLAYSPDGLLTICEMGNRRVTRLEKDGNLTVLADKYEGKRFNSPHDLTYRSDGTLYFTDPPFGLPKLGQDPRKELAFSGVYSLRNGKLQLLDKELSGPHGIVLSPDEKYLYVTNHSGKNKVVIRYDANPDGSVSNRKVLFDVSNDAGKDALSGLKVDQQGNLYVTGPRGIWVVSPDGKHLGTILSSKHPRNLVWANSGIKWGGHNVYVCTPYALYRMKLGVPGPKGIQ